MGGGHVLEWPDKAMFAALLLMLAGTLGVVFGVMEMGGADIHFPDAFVVAPLEGIPAWWHALLSAATLALGTLSLAVQRRRFAWAGSATGLVSVGALGVVGLCVPFVVFNLLLSWREGEEKRGRRFAAHEWPDKTMAASLFILIGAVVSLVQGISIATGHFDPVWLGSILADRTATVLAALFDVAAAVFCVVASRLVFWQRAPWLGWAASGMMLIGAGFYILGPVLALLAMLLLALGHGEDEFASGASALET